MGSLRKNRVRDLKISEALLTLSGSVLKKFRPIPARIALGLCGGSVSFHTDPSKSLLKNGTFLTLVPRLNRDRGLTISGALLTLCLLYTSDAADE